MGLIISLSFHYQQLFDSLNLTLNDVLIDPKCGTISRNNDDLSTKLTEYERANIKIGAKVFLNNAEPERLREAIDNLLSVLGVSDLDNLILAYHPVHESVAAPRLNGAATNGTTNGLQNGTGSSSPTPPKEGVLTWGDGAAAVANLKKMWHSLEMYADDGRICQLGIADLDADTLADLYASCRVKPAIAQINLSACCVVPPEMQEFCAKHEIQLLTHSDSEGEQSFLLCYVYLISDTSWN